jgi:hypothetical protein
MEFFMNTKPLYQQIYDQRHENHYGVARYGHCMWIKLFPHYKKWLQSPIIDFGCGTGEEVVFLREQGFDCLGVDQVSLDNGMMVGDISKKGRYSQYNTALCVEVFEHLTNGQIKGLLENMQQCRRQIITIANDTSTMEVDGEVHELHINQKPFKTWRAILMDYFDIIETIAQKDERRIYLCRKKQDIFKEEVNKVWSILPKEAQKILEEHDMMIVKK